jgi:pyruvate dehydrogenase E2 component (dihydrolipoamide acetyltransferase)
MASEIKLPELGEKLEEAEVLEIRVAPGDTVREGQSLLEVEAEKSTVEVPAPVAGKVTKLLVQRGDKIKVGQTFCLIDASPRDREPQRDPARKPAREQQKQEPPRAAQPSSQDVDGAQPAAAPATSVARSAGDGRAVEQPQPAAEQAHGTLVSAGPATRRLARELGVDLARVQGSAQGGRVTPDDVKAFVRQLATTPATPGRGVEVPSLPDFERWGPVERRALDPVRRKTAEHMSLAWSVVPHVTHYDRADITELDGFRRQHETVGTKLTVTAFALKAAAVTLAQFPQFNASLDSAAGQLVLKHYYHIGVAVDTERGLLVPVLRDVDRKSIQHLAKELTDVAERARQKKISAEDMRGGTFTITNLGGIGGTGFSPIINYPEVAILGLARARLEPVVRDGAIVARLVLPLSLSYDHRVIDGADAARFTRRLAELLEKPLLMLLHA